MKSSRSFSVVTFFLIFVFIGLGTWQLHRKSEKELLLQTLSQSQKTPVQHVDSVTTPRPFQPLYAEGHFIPGKTIFLQAKTYQGKSGVYVLDVLQTPKGKFLLVQRGWSSKELTPFSSGVVRVEGIARVPSLPNYFQPANKYPTYFWINLKGLAQDLNVPLLPYYLIAKRSGDPRIHPTSVLPALPNHHLQYAITWYSLAFAFIIMLLWKRKHDLKKDFS